MSTRVQVPGFAAFTALAICCIRGRPRVHLFLLRITIANLRPFRFCWGGRFVSVVRSTSNPASSAAFNKSPLLNVSHPCALASLTIWPCSARGECPWAFRGQRECALTANRSFRTPCCKVQYRGDLFPRHVELFHDFLDAQAIL